MAAPGRARRGAARPARARHLAGAGARGERDAGRGYGRPGGASASPRARSSPRRSVVIKLPTGSSEVEAASRRRTVPTVFRPASARTVFRYARVATRSLYACALPATARPCVPVAPAAPTARANRVSYRRGPLTEWYANGPLGLEQGFTLKAPSDRRRSGPLTLALSLSGSLRPVARTRSTDRSASRARASGNGPRRLRRHEAKLPARLDAARTNAADPRRRRTRPLPAHDRSLRPAGQADRSGGAPTTRSARVGSDLRRHDRRGRLAGRRPGTDKGRCTSSSSRPAAGRAATADGEADRLGRPQRQLGVSVAISGDTIVAGARATISGTVPGRRLRLRQAAGRLGERDQTAKLTASDGAGVDCLGSSVAIAGDTIVAGRRSPDVAVHDPGAAYVFVKPVGGWASGTQTAKLTASDGAADDLARPDRSRSRATRSSPARPKSTTSRPGRRLRLRQACRRLGGRDGDGQADRLGGAAGI